MAGAVRNDGAPGGAARPPGGPATTPAGGARPLGETLVPGSVLSGRVVQGLGQDLYLLALRGRTLVAESSLPLAADTLVKVQVMGSGDRLSLRLLDEHGADQATTSDAPARARVLGLPADGAAQAVLAAFEDAGAPLDRDLLRTAISAVTAAGARAALAEDAPPTAAEAVPAAATTSAALLRNAAPAALARAYATVARSGLPATPATLALALRATATPLPNPAAALTVALAAGAASRPATAGSPGMPAAPVPTGPPPTVASTGGARTAVPGSAPAPAPAPSVRSPSSPSSAAGSPTVAPARPGPAAPDAPAATTATSMAEPSSIPSGSASPPARIASPRPGPTAAPTGSAPPTARDAPVPLAGGALAARLVPSAPLRTATIPDAVREGAAGVRRALSLAGVRSSPDGAAPANSSAAPATAVASAAQAALPGLLRQLAAALPRPESSGTAPTSAEDAPARGDPADPLGGVTGALTSALVHTAHEQAGQTVFKPDALADYRLVLSLPLQADGQPTPARLAIGERPGPDGATTYLRVDTELSDLGTVSVRLSGVDGGPLTITLVGSAAGSRALEEALPALVGSLRALGLTAGVRVVDGEPG